MPDPFVPAGPMRASQIYDGRPAADPFTRTSPTDPITLSSSADMFAFVNQGASVAPDRGPYSITPATLTRGGVSEGVTLVAINGTHIGWAREANQGTAIVTDLRAGVGIETAYVRSVKADLMALPPGTKIVLAGHSLGGMVAQEIAADPQIRARLEVLNTVAFGSPPIQPHRQEGDVHRLVDAHDPVPLLSWDAVRSNVTTGVEGAVQGGRDAIDRSADVARRGGLRGIFSREMLDSVLDIPRAVGDGVTRGMSQSDTFANTTVRDANMPEDGVTVPGTGTYLSIRTHSESYRDPQTWSGVTALGEAESPETRTSLTFKESDVRWRMTEPVLTHPAWSLPILRELRPYLSEVDPQQMRPALPGQDQSDTRLALGDAAPENASVSGDRVRAALAMVLRSDAGVPETAALEGTRAEQLAAVHDVMVSRGVAPLTPEHSAAVLALAETLGPDHLGTPGLRGDGAGRPLAEQGATRLAQADRPAPEVGRSV